MAVNRTMGGATLFGVAYLGTKDIFSTDNSSPQTTQINAKHRISTLMKWVNVAAVECLFLIGCLMLAAPRGDRKWPFLGGMTGLGVTYGMYLHAKKEGLKEVNLPVTEDTAPPQPPVAGMSTGTPVRRRRFT